MIIERLVERAQNATDSHGEPILADPAFPSREPVYYLIVLKPDGTCLGISRTGTDVQEGRRKIWKPNKYRIPAIGDRASEKQAGLLCDVTSYIFGGGPWSVTTKKDGTVNDDSSKHITNSRTFRDVLDTALSELPNDEALLATQAFYRRYESDFEALLRANNLWLQSDVRTKERSVFANKQRFAFTLSDDLGQPAFERPDLQSYWRKHYDKRLTSKSVGRLGVPCLACGELRPPVSNHERTIKLPWGQRKGVKLVSFEGTAFRSQGLEQSLNAPMCQECVEAYTLCLRHLLERGQSTNYIDNDAEIAYAFWSRVPTSFDLNATLIRAEEGAVESLYESLHRPSQSEDISQEEANDFYVLALSASGARAIVRDWIEAHLPAVQRNIQKWFDDLNVIADRPWPSKKESRIDVGGIFGKFPLRVICQSAGRKSQRAWDVPPELSSRLFRAGLTGTVVADSVLASALRRIRADHDIPPPRAALIKLILNRLVQSRKKGEDEVTETLDPNKADKAYVCGRLLAVLERVQRRALGNINATVIDRYYGTASTAPRPIFPRLIANAQNHLGKLRGERPGEAENLQKDLETVIAKVGDPDTWSGDLPQWLDLEGQGRFAIGFYHQRAEYRSRFKKKGDNTPSPQEPQTPTKEGKE